MTKYEITIDEELNGELLEIADATGRSADDILHDLIIRNLKNRKVALIIQQYKDGHIKAREAWKLSGLNYQEFQDLVNTDDEVSQIIQQYKAGHIKAREAWKLSGLSYQEFQNRANSR